MLGGAFFYKVENYEEAKRRNEEDSQRIVIRGTIIINHPDILQIIFLSEFAKRWGKKLNRYTCG